VLSLTSQSRETGKQKVGKYMCMTENSGGKVWREGVGIEPANDGVTAAYRF